MAVIKPQLSLKKLQKDFLQQMLQQLNSPSEGIQTHFLRESGHFEVYQAGYIYRLIDVLLEDFPKLRIILGDQLFCDMAEKYIQAFPSQQPSLRNFGAQLPAFLENTTPYKQTKAFSEVARFELALSHNLDCADAETLSLENLQKLELTSWPHLTIQFHPSVQVQSFSTKVAPIWRALDNNPEQHLKSPEVLDSPVPILFWRQGIASFYRGLDNIEEVAFQAMQQRENFANTCELLTCFLPEDTAAESAANYLVQWVQDGLISSYSIGSIS